MFPSARTRHVWWAKQTSNQLGGTGCENRKENLGIERRVLGSAWQQSMQEAVQIEVKSSLEVAGQTG